MLLILMGNFVSKRFFSNLEGVLKLAFIFLTISPNIKSRLSGAIHLPEISCSSRLNASTLARKFFNDALRLGEIPIHSVQCSPDEDALIRRLRNAFPSISSSG